MWLSWYSNLFGPWNYRQTHYRVRYVARHQETRKSCDWFESYDQVNTVHIMPSRPVFWVRALSDGEGRDFSGRYKKWLDKRGKLSSILLRRQSLCFRECFPAHEVPSENVVYPKRKEYAFWLHQTSFQKEGETILTDVPPLKFYPIPWDKKFLAAQPEEKKNRPFALTPKFLNLKPTCQFRGIWVLLLCSFGEFGIL